MVEVVDYSSRRGVIVPMLPQIHAIFKENAEKDVLAALAPPAHYILWKQDMRRELVDIQRRWLFALDGRAVAGLLFYRFGGEQADGVYLHELQAAWAYRHNDGVLTILLDKFQSDKAAAACGAVYAGDRIKNEENKEILASVGFTEQRPSGWQPLGSVKEAVAALKLRYRRTQA